jgi:hypothetical protein
VVVGTLESVMSRSTVRILGLTLLIPAALLGILPLLVQYSDLSAGWSDFGLSIGNFHIVSFDSSAGRDGLSVSYVVWIVAAIGEALVVAGHFMRPSRRNRYTLSLN